jgi:surface antigen
MRIAGPIAVLLSALLLASCAGGDAALAPQPANVTGSVGSSSARSFAAAGVLGNGIGSTLDDRDRASALAAEIRALDQGEPGEPVGWKGAAGQSGTVVPGAYYETRGTRCRDYSHTIYVDGKPQAARATACRNTDGTWAPAS